MFFLHAEFELFVCNYVSDYENKAFKKLDKGLKKMPPLKYFSGKGIGCHTSLCHGLEYS